MLSHRTICFRIAILLAVLVSFSTTSLGQSKAVSEPFAKWMPGKRVWKLSVTKYFQSESKKDASKQTTYEVLAAVIGKEIVNKRPCWKLLLRPEKTITVFSSYFVAVDQQTGWVRKLSHFSVAQSIPKWIVAAKMIGESHSLVGSSLSLALWAARSRPRLVTADAAIQSHAFGSWVNKAYCTLPLEFFPLTEIDIDSGGTSISITKSVTDDVIEMQFAQRSDGHNIRIRQQWVKGEVWWREYERFVNDRIDLKARLLNAPDGRVSIAERFPLRIDPKLRVRISNFASRKPRLTDFLANLETRTKLTFSVEKNLRNHRPQFGVFTSKNGLYAWQVMEFIQQKQLQNGRWIKTPTGYRLAGESTAIAETPIISKAANARPVKATSPEAAANSAIRQWPGKVVLLWTILGIICLTSISYMALRYIRSQKRAPSND